MQRLARILLLLCAVVLIAGFFGVFLRLTALCFAILSAALLIFVPALRRRSFLWSALAAVLVLGVLPFDISLISRPGPPRVVRLVHGLPSKRGLEAARRGEIVLGGCVTTGFEPTWILVW